LGIIGLELILLLIHCINEDRLFTKIDINNTGTGKRHLKLILTILTRESRPIEIIFIN